MKIKHDEIPYQNREIREMFDDVRESLQRIEIQTTTTNGKVRKLTIGLVGVGGVLVGLGFQQLLPFILPLI